MLLRRHLHQPDVLLAFGQLLLATGLSGIVLLQLVEPGDGVVAGFGFGFFGMLVVSSVPFNVRALLVARRKPDEP